MEWEHRLDHTLLFSAAYAYLYAILLLRSSVAHFLLCFWVHSGVLREGLESWVIAA